MEVKQLDVIRAAAQLLVDNGLGDWHLDIKDVTSYLAQTRYDPKLIVINSRFITVTTKEQFNGVMYHEIAHALAGRGAGHGHGFKQKVYELTGSYEFAGYSAKVGVRKFVTECPVCGSASNTNREQKVYCRPCRTDRGIIQAVNVKLNPLRLVEWK